MKEKEEIRFYSPFPLNGTLLVFTGIFQRGIVKITWYNSLMLEYSYSLSKSNDGLNLTQFVWGTICASYHFLIHCVQPVSYITWIVVQ